MSISAKLKKDLEKFLHEQKSPDLVTAYLFFLEKNFKIQPVLSTIEKKIYKNSQAALQEAEEKQKIWKQTEIKIGYQPAAVNTETKKIYICPFTGKAFGDNTHPNPQDAIYEWVSKCHENNEMRGGVKAKRFFISEDPEMIKNYIKPVKEPMTRTVYSSVMSGKLFNTQQGVIEDFQEQYLKPLSLMEVHNQNRYQIEPALESFLEEHLQEEKLSTFVEMLSDMPEFAAFVSQWVEDE